jgi:hypothetical protein
MPDRGLYSGQRLLGRPVKPGDDTGELVRQFGRNAV